MLSESKQKAPIELEILREKLDEGNVKNKDYLEEIKQLRMVTKELNEQVGDSEESIKRCKQELIECGGKLEDIPREIRELQESHHTVTRELKEEFERGRTLLEEEHQTQIRIERDRLEKLERLAESLSNSKHELTEQHCKALEENIRKWQDDINERMVEWQRELDQSYDLVREAKATIHSKDAKIETLDQGAQGTQNRIQSLTSELDRAKEAQQTALKLQEELKFLKQEIEKDLNDLRQALKGAENEKKQLGEQVAQLGSDIEDTTRENKSLEASLQATRQKLVAKVKEASAALKESGDKKQRLISLQGQVERTEKQLHDSQ